MAKFKWIVGYTKLGQWQRDCFVPRNDESIDKCLLYGERGLTIKRAVLQAKRVGSF